MTANSDDVIAVDRADAPDVRPLLERHLAFAQANTLAEEVHALDLDALLDPSITFVSLRRDGRVLGVGALRRLDPTHAELKSMHTAQEARGTGVGRALVQHLVATAREWGVERISLETGAGPAFLAARTLYARAGFEECGAFGDYPSTPRSTFMTMRLSPGT